MRVVYIAGPYRAPTTFEIEENIGLARDVAADVACLGAIPICPHLNTAHFDGLKPEQFWLDGYREVVTRCDAVLTLCYWDESEGATGEVELARNRGIPVFHQEDMGALERWLNEPERKAA